ncbi:MAG: nucleoside-diphosphate-sugar epimerase [Bradymonadia bacterium]|jgi:nucleoside-diphosphate-sugar epimerase
MNASASLDVAAVLAGKRILLTGASGFLGKVALLRLLDRVPEAGHVTLLMRPGSFDTAEARFAHIVATSPAFGPLREVHGEAVLGWLLDRVSIVAGDIAHPNLRLDDDACASLRESVDVIVHCAALVDFDPDIRLALSSNVVGSLYVSAFAESCERAALVHVSTCYVAGLREGRVDELPVGDHSPSGDAFDAELELVALENAIAVIEREHDGDPPRRVMVDLGRDRARALGWPNSYTYTKALAEALVTLRHPDLSHAVLRPSIVESAVSFPFPGWNEGYNTCGPLAYLVGTWFKALPAKASLPFDVIPVDFVASALWVATARVLNGNAPPVFQCATSAKNPLTLGRALELTGLSQRRHLRSNGATLTDRQLRSRFDTTAFDTSHVLSLSSVTEAMKTSAEALRKLPKGTPTKLKQEASTLSRKLTRNRRTLSGIEATVDAFTPFIRDIRQTFVADALSRQIVADPDLRFAPESIDWRDYWLNIHMPGMRKWCFPKIEESL